jgi:BASS family bile acid:Na+ symporter
MPRILQWLTNAFPVWVLLGGVLALVHPPWVTWFNGPFIVWGLAVIMLGMGITLSVEDFRRVLKLPQAVAAGFAAQYCIMPVLARLPQESRVSPSSAVNYAEKAQ